MNKDNQVHFENEEEIRKALRGIKEEGKKMSSNGEWNDVKAKSSMLRSRRLAIKSNYKLISAAASLLLVAAIGIPLAFSLTGGSNETVKTARPGNDKTETTKPKVIVTDDNSQIIDDDGLDTPDVSTPDKTVPTTTVQNSTPDNTWPDANPSIEVPTGLKLVSAIPVGPTADTQTYNVTLSWDAQSADVRYCGEIYVMEFEDNDPLKASHSIYHSGSTVCDYDTEAIQGNTVTYTLELTKGNEFRFFLDAINLHDQKGTRGTSFIVQ